MRLLIALMTIIGRSILKESIEESVKTKDPGNLKISRVLIFQPKPNEPSIQHPATGIDLKIEHLKGNQPQPSLNRQNS